MSENLPAAPAGQLPALTYGALAAQPGRFATNLDPMSPEDRNELARCLLGDALGADDVGDSLLLVRAFVARPVDLVDDVSGELSQVVRVVLSLADGRRVSFSSQGVADSLGVLINLYPPATWGKGLALKLIRKPRRSGAGKVYLLVPADDADLQKGKVK